MRMYESMYVCVYVCMHDTYICTYICMHVCMYASNLVRVVSGLTLRSVMSMQVV